MKIEANGGSGNQAESSQQMQSFEGEEGSEPLRIEGNGEAFPWKYFEVVGLPLAHENDKAAGH